MKHFLVLLCIVVTYFSTEAQISRPSGSTTGSTTTVSNPLTGTGNETLVSGLKEALSVSAIKSADILSATNGFFGNQAIKILMPPEAKAVESKLRSFGLGSEVDKMLLTMNRAAEEAAKDAAPIFLDAIKGMSVSDAVALVTGPNDAATQYLRKSTSAQLTEKFTPVIDKALDKTEATKYWSDVFTTYNKLPFATPINPDLEKYVTEKALDGLFYTMALQEAQIRKDPAATANSLIESVFGKK